MCSLSFLHSFFTYLCLVSYFFLVLQYLVLVSSSTSITKSTKFLLRLHYFFIFFIVVLILVLAHRYTLCILYSSSIIVYLLSRSIWCVRITSWSHTKNFVITTFYYGRTASSSSSSLYLITLTGLTILSFIDHLLPSSHYLYRLGGSFLLPDHTPADIPITSGYYARTSSSSSWSLYLTTLTGVDFLSSIYRLVTSISYPNRFGVSKLFTGHTPADTTNFFGHYNHCFFFISLHT